MRTEYAAFALGRARAPIIVAYEQAKADLAKHSASERPSDMLGVADWHCIQARLMARRDALKEAIDIIDKEIAA